MEDMHKCLMENLLRTNFMGFFRFIGVNAPIWPQDVVREFHKHVDKKNDEPWKDFVYLKINGTVVSGLSTRTTLGNTMRSLMYVYYYLWD